MFYGDVSSLKDRVAQYEKHIKKLKTLVDKEDTAALVKQLQNEKDLPDLDQVQQEIRQVNEQVTRAKKKKI